MNYPRQGLTIIEILAGFIVIGIGAVFGLGLATMWSQHGHVGTALAVIGTVAFIGLFMAMTFSASRGGEWHGRRIVLVKARDALREVLLKQGMDRAAADAEVERLLPASLGDWRMR